ncbi:uncharacterized protein TNCT_239571 [Trichonephila clavata]|uniref:Thyroglobulin type-1 domain-containing protein n=1 Tax=Trichonephila clavata TaxID=2740835 RepID=A0A8X6L2U8_TRICU|nr:uncharacterized protein TNCT_239571 [Trichonephila clavata]
MPGPKPHLRRRRILYGQCQTECRQLVFSDVLQNINITFCLLVIATVVCPSETYCEQHRNREKNSNGLVKMVPNCDTNGDYMPMQCFQGSKFCSCYDKSGNPVTQPSTKLKSCNCLVKRYEAQNKKLIGNFIPQCETDGTYKKRQCNGSTGYCYCVNPMTGEKKGDAKRGMVNC